MSAYSYLDLNFLKIFPLKHFLMKIKERKLINSEGLLIRVQTFTSYENKKRFPYAIN